MKIREANNSDSENIKKIVFGVLKEYGLDPDSGTIDKDLDDIEQYYNANGGYFGVIEQNNCIVATVGIYKMSENTCELRKMYILARCRGKGLGKKIVEFSLKKAKALGFNHMVLETASALVEAIALYKKCGFIEYKPEHLSSRCDQAFEINIL